MHIIISSDSKEDLDLKKVQIKNYLDFFHTGVKINDSAIIYLHEDINNKYNQYYTENTNILNTEIENTYFNLNIKQTDFVSIKNNLIIKKYTFANNNKVNLNINFIAYYCIIKKFGIHYFLYGSIHNLLV